MARATARLLVSDWGLATTLLMQATMSPGMGGMMPELSLVPELAQPLRLSRSEAVTITDSFESLIDLLL